jgi:hypothetical protein
MKIEKSENLTMGTRPTLVKPAEYLPNAPDAQSATSDNQKRREHRVNFIHNGRLVETVVGPAGFLKFAVASDLALHDSYDYDGTQIYPPHNLKSMVDTGLLKFPTGVVPYVSTSSLTEEIRGFFTRYADVPHDWLDVIPYYVLMSWVYERFTALPYLRFLGEPGTGKTRLLIVTSAISYKATVASGNITGPALFRTIDLVRGTMAIDEADFKNSEEWCDVVKVLNTGYMTGTPVIRCSGYGFTPEAFHVFGPKIISTRSRFSDEAIETRCLTFETRERVVAKHIPYQLPVAFEEEAVMLRNKLLRWRFENFYNVHANEEGLRELFPRFGQIGASLVAVAPTEECRGKLVDFLTRYDAARKEGSDKSLVLQALEHLSAEGAKTATVGTIAVTASGFAHDLGQAQLTPKRVGGILRSMGMVPRKTKKGYVVEIPPNETAPVNV